MIDFTKAQSEFEKYLDGYDRENNKIRLKIVHTYGVMHYSEEIARRLNLSPEDSDLSKIIALLHDIGRFEQIKRYDSFLPDTMDHASYGVMLLFGENRIRRFVPTPEWDSIIKTAIAHHSDYQLPTIADPRTLLHARLIRDADKLDNCRVKLEDSLEILLGMSGEEAGATAISPKIAETFCQKKCILSSDRQTPMDYWVSYFAYFYDINFKESLEIIQEQNYVSRIIRRIPCSNLETQSTLTQMEHFMNEYINQRLDKF